MAGPFKMKYNNSAFPFKSPANFSLAPVVQKIQQVKEKVGEFKGKLREKIGLDPSSESGGGGGGNGNGETTPHPNASKYTFMLK